MSPKLFSGDVTWGCGYLRQICSVLVRVKRRVLPGMSTFRISNMKIDRTTPLRIVKNCCPQLDKAQRNGHINEFLLRMQFSGYDKEFRFDVFNSANKAYQVAQQRDESGEKPMHRRKEWERSRRKKEKLEKRKSWYKNNGTESVIFVPFTPGGKLKRAFEEEIKKSKFKIKVVEQTGTKLKDILHRKDPFKQDRCDRADCFVCTTGGKGNCSRENTSFQISCTEE